MNTLKTCVRMAKKLFLKAVMLTAILVLEFIGIIAFWFLYCITA